MRWILELIVALSLNSEAFAQSSPNESGESAEDIAKIEAKALYQEGMAAVDAEDFAKAADRFGRALKKKYSGIAAYNLAYTYSLLGKKVDARNLLEEIEKRPDTQTKVRGDVVTLRAQIEDELGRVSVTFENAKEAQLVIDGIERSEQNAHWLELGEHSVSATSARGGCGEHSVSVEAGTIAKVTFVCPKPIAPKPPEPASRMPHILIGSGMALGGAAMPVSFLLGAALQSDCGNASVECEMQTAPLMMTIGAGALSIAGGVWLALNELPRSGVAKWAQAGLGVAGGLLSATTGVLMLTGTEDCSLLCPERTSAGGEGSAWLLMGFGALSSGLAIASLFLDESPRVFASAVVSESQTMVVLGGVFQ